MDGVYSWADLAIFQGAWTQGIIYPSHRGCSPLFLKTFLTPNNTVPHWKCKEFYTDTDRVCYSQLQEAIAVA